MHSSRSKPKPNLPQAHHSYQFEAIGTSWVIEIYEPVAEGKLKKLNQAIQERIELFDKYYSRFRSDSLVAKMATSKGSYVLPDDAEPMVDLYQHLYELTNGAMTPLIGQTLSDAGYDASYSLQTNKMSSPPSWEDVMTYSFPNLHVKQPALLDFGAAGKGYLVDIVAVIIEEQAIHNYCVDAGGDMVYQTNNQQTMSVGLEDPRDASQVVGTAIITNQALCGSAGNRRTWGKFHHIIDPKLLESPQHIQALWVVADTGLLADGIATALFFVPPLVITQHYSFEYAIINQDYSLSYSPNFPGSFYN